MEVCSCNPNTQCVEVEESEVQSPPQLHSWPGIHKTLFLVSKKKSVLFCEDKSCLTCSEHCEIWIFSEQKKTTHFKLPVIFTNPSMSPSSYLTPVLPIYTISIIQLMHFEVHVLMTFLMTTRLCKWSFESFCLKHNLPKKLGFDTRYQLKWK